MQLEEGGGDDDAHSEGVFGEGGWRRGGSCWGEGLEKGERRKKNWANLGFCLNRHDPIPRHDWDDNLDDCLTMMMMMHEDGDENVL